MRALLSIAAVAVSLAGCAGDVREIGQRALHEPGRHGSHHRCAAFRQRALPAIQAGQSRSSIWNGGRADIFSDPRAAKIGDVVTVHIAINDSATFGNATDRSLNSQVNTGFNWTLTTANTK